MTSMDECRVYDKADLSKYAFGVSVSHNLLLWISVNQEKLAATKKAPFCSM